MKCKNHPEAGTRERGNSVVCNQCGVKVGSVPLVKKTVASKEVEFNPNKKKES